MHIYNIYHDLLFAFTVWCIWIKYIFKLDILLRFFTFFTILVKDICK